MTDIAKILREELKKEEAKLGEILEKLGPIHEQKNELEQNIMALRQLIASKTLKSTGWKEHKPSTGSGTLRGKTAKPAYKKAAMDHFQDEPFREREMREYATSEPDAAHPQ